MVDLQHQWRNEGGHNSPGVEKSQQCHKYFPQYSAFATGRPTFEHGGAKLASFPGAI